MYITKTCPCSMKQFLKVKKKIFLYVKMRYIILISAQNIDFGYTLEPPR